MSHTLNMLKSLFYIIIGKTINADNWVVIVAYLFAIIIAHFPIRWVVKRIWESVGVDKSNEGDLRAHAWTAGLVGGVERGLYLAALQINLPQFIGVWLAIKVAGSWKSWTEGIKEDKRKGLEKTIEGRTIFQIFLVGNGLSIAYAALAWKFTEWCIQQFLIAFIGLLIGTAILRFVACYYGRRKK